MHSISRALATLAMNSPFLVIVLILVYYYLFRVPWWRRRKAARRRPRFYWSTAGLGTALLSLTLFYRPRLLHAVEAQHRQVEDADEDDNGDPDSPEKHLMRQLRRIRRGEEVDVLSLRLR